MRNNIRWKRWLLAPFGVVLLFFLSTARGGRGEFCPQTLQMRTYSLQVVWFADYAIYESKPESDTPEICTFLVERGYWTRSEEPAAWIFAFYWSPNVCPGYVSWYREFIAHDDEWMSWTEDNPAWAKVFWSQMLEALRNPETSPYHHAELINAKRWSGNLEGYLDYLNSIKR